MASSSKKKFFVSSKHRIHESHYYISEPICKRFQVIKKNMSESRPTSYTPLFNRTRQGNRALTWSSVRLGFAWIVDSVYESLPKLFGVEGNTERSNLLKNHVWLSTFFLACFVITFPISVHYGWKHEDTRTCFERFVASFRLSMASVFFILNQVILVYYDSEDRQIARRKRLDLARYFAIVVIVALAVNIYAVASITDKPYRIPDYARAALSSVIAVGSIHVLMFPYLSAPQH